MTRLDRAFAAQLARERQAFRLLGVDPPSDHQKYEALMMPIRRAKMDPVEAAAAILRLLALATYTENLPAICPVKPSNSALYKTAEFLYRKEKVVG